METEFSPNPPEPFFLIVADHVTKRFCVEGPMTDDGPWNRAAGRARESDRDVRCGPKGSDRRSLSVEFQKTSGFGGCPPGSFLRPRE
jgi:hypothetical protein